MGQSLYTEAQKAALLEWIAEGIRTDEINRRAAKFDPPFKISRNNVDYYRRRCGVRQKDIARERDERALNGALATVAGRLEKLQQLAELHEKDLFGGRLWVHNVKGIGRGDDYQVVGYDEYNAAEVAQYRGILDDIAREVGQRTTKTEVTGKDGGPVEQVIIYVPDNQRNPHD